MGAYSVERFMPVTSDGKSLDVFSARFRDIQNLPEQQRVTVDAAYAHNLPTLAYEYLQDVNLWWAILMYNGLQDPIEDIVPGIVLRIPSKSRLTQLLTSQSATNNVMRI